MLCVVELNSIASVTFDRINQWCHYNWCTIPHPKKRWGYFITFMPTSIMIKIQADPPKIKFDLRHLQSSKYKRIYVNTEYLDHMFNTIFRGWLYSTTTYSRQKSWELKWVMHMYSLCPTFFWNCNCKVFSSLGGVDFKLLFRISKLFYETSYWNVWKLYS